MMKMNLTFDLISSDVVYEPTKNLVIIIINLFLFSIVALVYLSLTINYRFLNTYWRPYFGNLVSVQAIAYVGLVRNQRNDLPPTIFHVGIY